MQEKTKPKIKQLRVLECMGVTEGIKNRERARLVKFAKESEEKMRGKSFNGP